jgi:hypothetical protein
MTSISRNVVKHRGETVMVAFPADSLRPANELLEKRVHR